MAATITLQLFSSLKKTGIEEVESVVGPLVEELTHSLRNPRVKSVTPFGKGGRGIANNLPEGLVFSRMAKKTSPRPKGRRPGANALMQFKAPAQGGEAGDSGRIHLQHLFSMMEVAAIKFPV
jgi:hypothetical protein